MQDKVSAAKDSVAGLLYFSHPDTAALYEQHIGDGRAGIYLPFGDTERDYFNPGLSAEPTLILRILRDV
jgi:hypothetical protein